MKLVTRRLGLYLAPESTGPVTGHLQGTLLFLKLVVTKLLLCQASDHILLWASGNRARSQIWIPSWSYSYPSNLRRRRYP